MSGHIMCNRSIVQLKGKIEGKRGQDQKKNVSNQEFKVKVRD